MRRRRHVTTAALAAMVAGGGVAVAAPAVAAAGSTAAGGGAVSSASWGAAPVAPGGNANGSSYAMTWNLPATASQYFQVVNTGSLGLSGETYTATNSKPTNGTAPPTIALDACVGGTWNTTANTCAGSVVRLTTSGAGTAAVNVSIAVGSALSVRATPTTLPNFPQTFTTTVSVSIDRSQVRAGSTANS